MGNGPTDLERVTFFVGLIMYEVGSDFGLDLGNDFALNGGGEDTRSVSVRTVDFRGDFDFDVEDERLGLERAREILRRAGPSAFNVDASRAAPASA